MGPRRRGGKRDPPDDNNLSAVDVARVERSTLRKRGTIAFSESMTTSTLDYSALHGDLSIDYSLLGELSSECSQSENGVGKNNPLLAVIEQFILGQREKSDGSRNSDDDDDDDGSSASSSESDANFSNGYSAEDNSLVSSIFDAKKLRASRNSKPGRRLPLTERFRLSTTSRIPVPQSEALKQAARAEEERVKSGQQKKNIWQIFSPPVLSRQKALLRATATREVKTNLQPLPSKPVAENPQPLQSEPSVDKQRERLLVEVPAAVAEEEHPNIADKIFSASTLNSHDESISSRSLSTTPEAFRKELSATKVVSSSQGSGLALANSEALMENARMLGPKTLTATSTPMATLMLPTAARMPIRGTPRYQPVSKPNPSEDPAPQIRTSFSSDSKEETEIVFGESEEHSLGKDDNLLWGNPNLWDRWTPANTDPIGEAPGISRLDAEQTSDILSRLSPLGTNNAADSRETKPTTGCADRRSEGSDEAQPAVYTPESKVVEVLPERDLATTGQRKAEEKSAPIVTPALQSPQGFIRPPRAPKRAETFDDKMLVATAVAEHESNCSHKSGNEEPKRNEPAPVLCSRCRHELNAKSQDSFESGKMRTLKLRASKLAIEKATSSAATSSDGSKESNEAALETEVSAVVANQVIPFKTEKSAEKNQALDDPKGNGVDAITAADAKRSDGKGPANQKVQPSLDPVVAQETTSPFAVSTAPRLVVQTTKTEVVSTAALSTRSVKAWSTPGKRKEAATPNVQISFNDWAGEEIELVQEMPPPQRRFNWRNRPGRLILLSTVNCSNPPLQSATPAQSTKLQDSEITGVEERNNSISPPEMGATDQLDTSASVAMPEIEAVAECVVPAAPVIFRKNRSSGSTNRFKSMILPPTKVLSRGAATARDKTQASIRNVVRMVQPRNHRDNMPCPLSMAPSPPPSINLGEQTGTPCNKTGEHTIVDSISVPEGVEENATSHVADERERLLLDELLTLDAHASQTTADERDCDTQELRTCSESEAFMLEQAKQQVHSNAKYEPRGGATSKKLLGTPVALYPFLDFNPCRNELREKNSYDARTDAVGVSVRGFFEVPTDKRRIKQVTAIEKIEETDAVHHEEEPPAKKKKAKKTKESSSSPSAASAASAAPPRKKKQSMLTPSSSLKGVFQRLAKHRVAFKENLIEKKSVCRGMIIGELQSSLSDQKLARSCAQAKSIECGLGTFPVEAEDEENESVWAEISREPEITKHPLPKAPKRGAHRTKRSMDESIRELPVSSEKTTDTQSSVDKAASLSVDASIKSAEKLANILTELESRKKSPLDQTIVKKGDTQSTVAKSVCPSIEKSMKSIEKLANIRAELKSRKKSLRALAKLGDKSEIAADDYETIECTQSHSDATKISVRFNEQSIRPARTQSSASADKLAEIRAEYIRARAQKKRQRLAKSDGDVVGAEQGCDETIATGATRFSAISRASRLTTAERKLALRLTNDLKILAKIESKRRLMGQTDSASKSQDIEMSLNLLQSIKKSRQAREDEVKQANEEECRHDSDSKAREIEESLNFRQLIKKSRSARDAEATTAKEDGSNKTEKLPVKRSSSLNTLQGFAGKIGAPTGFPRSATKTSTPSTME